MAAFKVDSGSLRGGSLLERKIEIEGVRRSEKEENFGAFKGGRKL